MKTVEVNSLEWEALLNLEKMIRMALVSPGAGEFVAVAIQALDAVRSDSGGDFPGVTPAQPMMKPGVSDLASSLIQRAMKK